MILSVITVNLNDSEGLKKTLDSIVMQTIADFEIIVIDGGSTNASIEIIREYETKISYWDSKPDNGIYHAMQNG